MIKINCDYCDRDVSESSNSVDYRIVVKSESIPSCGAPVTDMFIDPEILQDYHFW